MDLVENPFLNHGRVHTHSSVATQSFDMFGVVTETIRIELKLRYKTVSDCSNK